MRENPPFRAFKLILVPLVVFSLVAQIALAWTQLDDIRAGYFDFPMYYSAAKIIDDGHRTQLFDLSLQRKYQEALRPPMEADLPFNHLPYELLLLLPLTALSMPAAQVLWVCFNALLLAAILLRLMPLIEPQQRWLTGLMLIAFFPTVTTLKMGQDSVLTTYVLTETLICLKAERYAFAGCWLAVGLYKPQFVLPIAGLLFMQRCRPAILGFCVTAAVILGVCFAMVGGSGLAQLLSLWLPMTGRGNYVWPELMVNLRGLSHLFLEYGNVAGATNIATLLTSGLVYYLSWRLWNEKPKGNLELRYSLAVLTTALVSFHLYSYDTMLLVLPLILTLNYVLKRSWHSAHQQAVLLAIIIFMFLPLVPNILVKAWALAWWTVPVLSMYGLLAWELAKMTVSERASHCLNPGTQFSG
jgi:hypothetical protein